LTFDVNKRPRQKETTSFHVNAKCLLLFDVSLNEELRTKVKLKVTCTSGLQNVQFLFIVINTSYVGMSSGLWRVLIRVEF